ncbi:MAG TPA: response regulator transcription factor [Solirubrobacteraceae bacterium]
MIRVVIADDHSLVRGGFRVMLETEDDIRVVGEAADGRDAIDAVRRARPDVVVMDIRMPLLDGIEATRQITQADLPTRVLVVTTFDLDEYVFAALRAGAAGFLLKEATPAQLVEAVRTVADGEALLAPRVTRRLVEHFVQVPEPDRAVLGALAELTERERDVLGLIARGLSNQAIGRELFLSEATIKTHVTRVLAKLGLRSRTQAVVLAYESGLVRVGSQHDAGAA